MFSGRLSATLAPWGSGRCKGVGTCYETSGFARPLWLLARVRHHKGEILKGSDWALRQIGPALVRFILCNVWGPQRRINLLITKYKGLAVNLSQNVSPKQCTYWLPSSCRHNKGSAADIMSKEDLNARKVRQENSIQCLLRVHTVQLRLS
jgi:hypothetical protein